VLSNFSSQAFLLRLPTVLLFLFHHLLAKFSLFVFSIGQNIFNERLFHYMVQISLLYGKMFLTRLLSPLSNEHFFDIW